MLWSKARLSVMCGHELIVISCLQFAEIIFELTVAQQPTFLTFRMSSQEKDKQDQGNPNENEGLAVRIIKV